MSSRSTLAFLRTETGSGLLLALTALAAIIWANSPWAASHLAFAGHPVPVRLGPFAETLSVEQWVRSALMPVFFFVLGLEIKHEVLRGELANPRRLALPLLAALGGVIAPAAVYLAFTAGTPGALRGWAVPVGADIALALAALALAGPRLPPSLRVFLLTLAIAGDVAALALIALLFVHDLRPAMLAGAGASLAVLAAMSRWRTAPYVFWAAGALLLWAFTLKSGVDTALAGVAAAFCAPLGPKRAGGVGVLQEMMEALHPYVAFAVLPLFALTATGFSLAGDVDLGPVGLGLALALFVGKPVGVFGAASLAIGLKWARRPTGARWAELLGVAMLCGIGFTMSLYLGGLAFPAGDAQVQARAGAVLGSLASALAGAAILVLAARARREN